MPVPSQMSSLKAPWKIIKLTSSWDTGILKWHNADLRERNPTFHVATLIMKAGCLCPVFFIISWVPQSFPRRHVPMARGSNVARLHVPGSPRMMSPARSTAGIQLVDGPLQVPDDLIRGWDRQALLSSRWSRKVSCLFLPTVNLSVSSPHVFHWSDPECLHKKKKKIAKVNGPFSCSCKTLGAARSLCEDMYPTNPASAKEFFTSGQSKICCCF